MLRNLLFLTAVFVFTAQSIEQPRNLRSEIEIDWQKIGDVARDFISWIVQRFHRQQPTDSSDSFRQGIVPIDSDDEFAESSSVEIDFNAKLKAIDDAKRKEINALRAKRNEKLKTMIDANELNVFWEQQMIDSKAVEDYYKALRERVNAERFEYSRAIQMEKLTGQWIDAKLQGEKPSQELDAIWDQVIETKLINLGVLTERNDKALDQLQQARKERLALWWEKGGENKQELDAIWTEEIEKSKTLLQQQQQQGVLN